MLFFVTTGAIIFLVVYISLLRTNLQSAFSIKIAQWFLILLSRKVTTYSIMCLSMMTDY